MRWDLKGTHRVAVGAVVLAVFFQSCLLPVNGQDEAAKPVLVDGNSTVNGTNATVLTGDPQKDYVHDPNLPHEIGTYDLSDYPFYKRAPDPAETNFSCVGRHDGFYASVKHKCQVYFNCLFEIRYDFLCANYTVFDQKNFICHYASVVDCANSEKYYDRNDELYVTTTTTTERPRFAPWPRQQRPQRPQRPRNPQRNTTPAPHYEYFYDENRIYDDYDYYDYYDEPLSTSTTTTTQRPIKTIKQGGSGQRNRPRGPGTRIRTRRPEQPVRISGIRDSSVRISNRNSPIKFKRVKGKRKKTTTTSTTTTTTAAPGTDGDYYYYDYYYYDDEPVSTTLRTTTTTEAKLRNNRPRKRPAGREIRPAILSTNEQNRRPIQQNRRRPPIRNRPRGSTQEPTPKLESTTEATINQNQRGGNNRPLKNVQNRNKEVSQNEKDKIEPFRIGDAILIPDFIVENPPLAPGISLDALSSPSEPSPQRSIRRRFGRPVRPDNSNGRDRRPIRRFDQNLDSADN